MVAEKYAVEVVIFRKWLVLVVSTLSEGAGEDGTKRVGAWHEYRRDDQNSSCPGVYVGKQTQ